MLKTGTFTKTRMIEGITETNGFTCIKFIETAAIVLEQIKSVLETGDDKLIACFGRFCAKKSRRWGRNQAPAWTGYYRQERLLRSCSPES